MTRWARLVLLGTVGGAQLATGQVLAPGQRVRITTESTLTGRVDSVSRDRIWLSPSPAEPIPLDRIRKVELSRGRKPALGKAAAYGALAGAVVGGVLWAAFIAGDEYSEDPKELFALALIGGGAAGGALAGMGLSLTLARERWEIVPRDDWVRRSAQWRLGFRWQAK
jgi:hypothetical protein